MTEKELILTHLLNCPRDSLYLDKVNTEFLDKKVERILEERKRGVPLQYLLGKVNFTGFDIEVNNEVLIPRFETEILVEKTIQIIQDLKLDKFNLLDLCTGSGCIAIALAKFFNQAIITASDISASALCLARKNARINNVINKIEFIKSDLFSAFSGKNKRYNIITCNPPYIKTKDIDSLQTEISYEPKIALDGGKDGLTFYRKILKSAHLYLEKNGLLIFEIGCNQIKPITKLIKDDINLNLIRVFKDYNDIERVVVIKNG